MFYLHDPLSHLILNDIFFQVRIHRCLLLILPVCTHSVRLSAVIPSNNCKTKAGHPVQLAGFNIPVCEYIRIWTNFNEIDYVLRCGWVWPCIKFSARTFYPMRKSFLGLFIMFTLSDIIHGGLRLTLKFKFI